MKNRYSSKITEMGNKIHDTTGLFIKTNFNLNEMTE